MEDQEVRRCVDEEPLREQPRGETRGNRRRRRRRGARRGEARERREEGGRREEEKGGSLANEDEKEGNSFIIGASLFLSFPSPSPPGPFATKMEAGKEEAAAPEWKFPYEEVKDMKVINEAGESVDFGSLFDKKKCSSSPFPFLPFSPFLPSPFISLPLRQGLISSLGRWSSSRDTLADMCAATTFVQSLMPLYVLLILLSRFSSSFRKPSTPPSSRQPALRPTR